MSIQTQLGLYEVKVKSTLISFLSSVITGTGRLVVVYSLALAVHCLRSTGYTVKPWF